MGSLFYYPVLGWISQETNSKAEIYVQGMIGEQRMYGKKANITEQREKSAVIHLQTEALVNALRNFGIR